MKNMRLLVVCLIGSKLLFCNLLAAQNGLPVNRVTNALSLELSTSDLVHAYYFFDDEKPVTTGKQIGFAWSQPYTSGLTTSFSLSFSQISKTDRVVVSIRESGSSIYRESGLTAGYYRRFGDGFSAGLLLGVDWITGDEEMSVVHPVLEGWLRLKLNEKTLAGMYVAQLVWMRDMQPGGLLLPPVVFGGIRRALSAEFSLSTEVGFQVAAGYAWMTSLYAKPADGVLLVAGLDLLNQHVYSGVSFPLGKITCSFGLFYHSSLGATPSGYLEVPVFR